MHRTFFALTLFVTACNGTETGSPTSGTPPVDTEATPSASPPDAPPPPETCNGRDDDADSASPEAAPCYAACTSMAVASVPLELPTASSITVAPDSGETPELTAFTTVPDFCTHAPQDVVYVEDGVIEIGCGGVLVVDDRGLNVKSLRIAAGGIVRLTGNAVLSLSDTLLVCPNATIQGGVDAVRTQPAVEGALDAHNLEIDARVLVNLGTIDLRGGHVIGDDDARAGDGGGLAISVDRLLHAGLIDNSSGSPFNHGERGGSFDILARKESFFSGAVMSLGGGQGHVKVPAL